MEGRKTERAPLTEPVDVLIVAPRDDVHARAVTVRLEALGAKVLILDTAEYLREWSVTVAWISGEERKLVTTHSSGKVFDLGKVRGLWFRRFYPLRVAERMESEEIGAFAYNECRDFLHGLIATSENAINDPAREWAANRKVLQLHWAAKAGLRVPDTIITTEMSEVDEFDRGNRGGTIFKILTNTEFQFTETRRLRGEHRNQAQAIGAAPTIFQQRIDARHHLRVTYVDGESLTARLSPNQGFANDDWRLDPTRELEPEALDDKTAKKVRLLMEGLGLRFGALDFIVEDEGEPWFLEVNPCGQFLFCEIHAQLPISAALARALLGNVSASDGPAISATA